MLAADESVELPCLYDDALKLAGRIGESILLAGKGPFESASYAALANIGDVPVLADGTPCLRLERVSTFPRSVPAGFSASQATHLIEVSEDEFEHIVLQATGSGDFSEPPTPQVTRVPQDLFTRQLAAQQEDICAFSAIETSEGMAFIIRPLDQGGRWHAGNFLFLHTEPGELFSAFAWTIGPRFELITDLSAMTPYVTETANSTGFLAISDQAMETLDREALAWHRQQFFDRRR